MKNKGRSNRRFGVRRDGSVAKPRIVCRCRCSYQQEKPWGYHLWKWIGGRTSWKSLGNATHIDDALKYADSNNLKTILIKCNGCGAEMLREYPLSGKSSKP